MSEHSWDASTAPPMIKLAPGNRVDKSCGSCTLCCKVVPVASLRKPRDTWCSHCNPKAPKGKGCNIYAERPRECVEWDCLWRIDGDHSAPQPKQSGVVFDCLIDHAFQNGEYKPVL